MHLLRTRADAMRRAHMSISKEMAAQSTLSSDFWRNEFDSRQYARFTSIENRTQWLTLLTIRAVISEMRVKWATVPAMITCRRGASPPSALSRSCARDRHIKTIYLVYRLIRQIRRAIRRWSILLGITRWANQHYCDPASRSCYNFRV